MQEEKDIDIYTFITNQLEKEYSIKEIKDVLIEKGFNEEYISMATDKSMEEHLTKHLWNGASSAKIFSLCSTKSSNFGYCEKMTLNALVRYTVYQIQEGASSEKIDTLLHEKGLNSSSDSASDKLFESSIAETSLGRLFIGTIIKKALKAYAKDELTKRYVAKDIVVELLDKGFEEKWVNEAITNAIKERDKKSEKRMLFGFLILLFGIVVTIATYQNASLGGGTYVVMWGAIIFGAIQMFRG